jgi:hypothetical protein
MGRVGILSMNEKVETSCHGYLASNIKNIHGMTIGNLLFHITIQQNPLSNLELQSIKITEILTKTKTNI